MSETDDMTVNDNSVEPFKMSKEGVDYLNQKYLNRKFTEDIDYLEKLDGIKFITKSLLVNPESGLDEDESQREKRIDAFDSNESPPLEPINFCSFVLEAFEDKIIIILCVAAVVELILGMVFGDHIELDWIDGFCIIIAIFVVVSVGSIYNYSKEKKFRELVLKTRGDRRINIKRKGQWVDESEEALLVGDVIQIVSGMTIPCDCILIKGQAELDESAMTGEIDPLVKLPLQLCLENKQKKLEKLKSKGKGGKLSHHDVETPIVLSGTKVNTGDGEAIILAVGPNSENGKIKATINSNKSSSEGTPLEQKLSDLADLIGWAGLGAAIVTFIGMLLNFVIRIGIGQLIFSKKESKTLVNIFIIPIVVVVVAIPEGLPLAVTLTLALSIGEMLKDQNFVRRMESCETMGNAEYVCTDKTGTLTQNEMLVTKYYNFRKDIDLEQTVALDWKGKPDQFFNDKEWNHFMLSLACNSSTTFDEKGEEKGNKSDQSLTKLLSKFGENVKAIREKYILDLGGKKPQFIFTSVRKKMSTLITDNSLPTNHRLLLKGASEIVLKSCTHYLNENGERKELDRNIKEKISAKISEYASETLRTFCIAYKDISKEDLNNFYDTETIGNEQINFVEKTDFTLIGLIGIKDHLKDKVPEAIADCKRAGITVIMITGDNIDTAYAIAKNCNIATSRDQALLGDEFINKIGGVICKNCNHEFLGLDKDGNEIEGKSKNMQLEPNFACNCPRSKDEWVIKWKREKRIQDKKEKKDLVEQLRNDEFKKQYEEELEEEGFKAFEESGSQIRKDVIANIDNFMEIIKNLRVIARSQPNHKYALVTGLMQLEKVVAVTGDGTNDASALSKADVGFAMNAGTDIAKDAADIVILDDRFNSIVSAIMWGRNVFDNIRKFIQFQLTVNVAACTIVAVGASVGQKSPLTPIQMLWVNLIMDSLGSLALASEKPTERLLLRPPIKRNDFIINKKMFKHIFGQAIYQLIILFIIIFSAPKWLPEYREKWQNIAYQFKLCFTEAPIYFKDYLAPQNMYVMSGMESFFSESKEYNFPPNSICYNNDFFGGKKSMIDAYKNIISEQGGTTHYTFLFNLFVLMQLFNEFASRIIDDNPNIFFNLSTNISFIWLWLIEAGFQILIVCVTGPVFNVALGGIHPKHWGIGIGLALFTFPINLLLKYMPDPCISEEDTTEHKSIDNKGVISQIRKSATFKKENT